MNRADAVWILITFILIAFLTAGGCATAGVDGGVPLRGTTGPVAWEVADMGQVVSIDGARFLWSYVVVLKETAGISVQFDRMERASYTSGSEMIGGGPSSTPFRLSLAANSELRVPLTDSWGMPHWGTRSAARRDSRC